MHMFRSLCYETRFLCWDEDVMPLGSALPNADVRRGGHEQNDADGARRHRHAVGLEPRKGPQLILRGAIPRRRRRSHHPGAVQPHSTFFRKSKHILLSIDCFAPRAVNAYVNARPARQEATQGESSHAHHGAHTHVMLAAI